MAFLNKLRPILNSTSTSSTMAHTKTTTLTHEVAEWLKTSISIASYSREEEKKADFIEDLLHSLHLTPFRKGNNIWCLSEAWSAHRPTLLLNAHIDTVRPVGSWTKHPHIATQEENRIYGLGSNDCGGGLFCLLQTFRTLQNDANIPWNLIYLASAEEEVSGRNGIESVLPLLPPIDVALVGEPTGMQPAIAEKGLMVLDVTARGRSGHAARNEGINAIYQAIEDIEWFRNHRFEKKSSLLDDVKMSVTMISAGTQHNVIPDECKFTVDIRSNECYTNQEILDEIVKNISSEVKARSTRLNSSHIDATHPLIARATSMGCIPYGSPTLSDQALMPFPSFKMGPGESARSHTANEFITIEELQTGIETYLRLLQA